MYEAAEARWLELESIVATAEANADYAMRRAIECAGTAEGDNWGKSAMANWQRLLNVRRRAESAFNVFNTTGVN